MTQLINMKQILLSNSIIFLMMLLAFQNGSDVTIQKKCCSGGSSCMPLVYSEGVNFAPDSLYMMNGNEKCHYTLMPQNSVSTISNEVITTNHNGSGYEHNNGYNNNIFGYYLKDMGNGCFALFTWEDIQSGDIICP